jgi:hypothetical protein
VVVGFGRGPDDQGDKGEEYLQRAMGLLGALARHIRQNRALQQHQHHDSVNNTEKEKKQGKPAEEKMPVVAFQLAPDTLQTETFSK